MEKCEIRRCILALLIVGMLPLAGCFIYSNDVSYGEKGAPVSDRTLEQIECGKTTKNWVVATLGEPSQEETTKDGVEVLKYRYSKTEESNTVFLPFLIVDDEKRHERTIYFEVKDGVVQRYWKEDHRS